jgi:hypothetical protein
VCAAGVNWSEPSFHLSDTRTPTWLSIVIDLIPIYTAFIIQSYGSVLSPLPGELKRFSDQSHLDDPDQGNLSRALGSVVGIATLRAEGRVGPQLTSHVFGLLKARYVENQSQEDKWLSSDEGTEWVIRTVDDILDVAASDVHVQEAQVTAKLWTRIGRVISIPVFVPVNCIVLWISTQLVSHFRLAFVSRESGSPTFFHIIDLLVLRKLSGRVKRVAVHTALDVRSRG